MMEEKKFVVDHVTIAWSDLDMLSQVFARVGLETVYGGVHSNNITHMAILGFDDGSYIELISTLVKGQNSPWWSKQILLNGGPCAWAVRVEDIQREAESVRKMGIAVEGPNYYNRKSPDGTLVEWDLAFLGEGEPGEQLPFLIADRTPRSYRVRPSPSVAGSEMRGLEKVILGVNHLEATRRIFQQLCGWKEAEEMEVTSIGARLASFKDHPVILAQPLGIDGWLAERMGKFGENPCGYLIGSRDFNQSLERQSLDETEMWFGKRLAWFDQMLSMGILLGVVEV
jgi:hypothetical protein